MLRDLARGSDVVIPACVFGVPLMAELIRAGVFERGFPPDSGDSVVIDFGEEWVAFNVFKVRDKWQCVEDRDANPRILLLKDEDLTPCTLRREAFFALMAGDLGLTGAVAQLRTGLWELGRKSRPGRDRTKVVFAEACVPWEEIALFVTQDPFRSFCVLSAATYLDIPPIGDKTVVAGLVTVKSGNFTSSAFEDLEASGSLAASVTGVDLDSTPPKLVIMGEEFPMPIHKGSPPIGLKYLAMLIDRARESIPVWDVFLAGHPGDSDNETAGDEDEDDLAGSEEIMTGGKFSDKRSSIRPAWEDVDMDAATRARVSRDLAAKRGELESILKRGGTAGKVITKLREDIAALEQYLNAGQGAGGRRRAIKHGDRDKARDSVRGALKTVIKHVARQSPQRADELEKSLDLGYDVMFKPPPDWGI